MEQHLAVALGRFDLDYIRLGGRLILRRAGAGPAHDDQRQT